MSDFENIISFENLYRAHRRARLGKRHKKEVIEFEAHLSENLWSLHYDLKYGRYQVGGYHCFMIYDPKEREIQAISYRDRVVQHSLCDNYLTPLLNRHLIYDNVACRKKKGTSFAINRFREFMRDYYRTNGTDGYFVKADVTKYFPSIDHEILKEKVRKIVKDEKILKLLFTVIDSYQGDIGKGLPMGNQTSQCFALFYLDEVDRFMKEKLKVKYYIRYMDDMLMIIDGKEKARVALQEIKCKLEKNKLLLNPKSCITRIQNGVVFLGFRFFYSENGRIVQNIKRGSKKRILRHVKEVRKSEQDVQRRKLILGSYRGYMQKSDSYRFLLKTEEALWGR